MKSILIHVRENFTVPAIFLQGHDDSSTGRHPEDCQLVEIALLIGSEAVRQAALSGASSCLRDQAVQQCADLQNRLATMKETYEADIQRLKDEMKARSVNERARIKDDLEAAFNAEVERARREGALSAREQWVAERDALILRLEERHALMLSRAEQSAESRLAETRRTLDQLRAEHDGLIVKLMARLEPTASGASRIAASSAVLGRTFEDNVQRHLRHVFGARTGFLLEDVHSIEHSGDLIMQFDGLRILIELKSYDPKTRVPTKEVEKLARDLAEVQPPCDGGIMISACSEITGYYSCGPLEVSSNVACVPVLFINNFLSLGEPQITLHMMRVFLAMIQKKKKPSSSEEDDEASDEQLERLKRSNKECARRCTGYLVELNKQSTELLRQVSAMKLSAVKLRESVMALVESEVARLTGIVHLMRGADVAETREDISLDRKIFTDPLSASHRAIALRISEMFTIVSEDMVTSRIPTKDIIGFIQQEAGVASEKSARDILKAIFNEEVVKHGYILGISKKH